IPVVFEGVLSDLSMVEDLTAQKALEAELMIADRMAAIGRLAAAIGHEINNPLAYIVGNLTLLRREVTALGADGGPIARRLAVMEEGIDRVGSIVADLRRFSSVHEGELGAVDPAVAIEGALSTASHETKLRASVVRELHSTRHVRAEKRRLVQVLV